MQGVYVDDGLRAECRKAAEAFLTASPDGDERWSAFQGKLLRRVYEAIAEVVHEANGDWQHPPLILHRAGEPLTGGDVFADAEGVHAGEGLFNRLAVNLLVFADYLTDTFLWQIGPPIGDAPPLAAVVDLEDFPAQALTLNAASLVPGAVSPAGFARSIGSMLLEWLQDITFSDTSDPERLQVDFSRRVMKPANRDLVIYGQRLMENPLALVEAYDRADVGPYLHRLFWQLLLDATTFLLAHEMAHALLHHTETREAPSPAEAQAREARADEVALRLVQGIPGFLLASLMMLFAFCSRQEQDMPVEEMDHPFSHDRLLRLASAMLRDTTGSELRLNVNAGMALLARPVASLTLRSSWDSGGIAETSEVLVYQYADMDYNAHLFFYLERPPRLAEPQDAGRENAYLICLNTFKADLLLRDRVRPDVIHKRGQLLVRPGGVADDMLFDSGGGRALTRIHVRIPAPAEWWLTHPDAEAVVENVQAADEPLDELTDSEGNFRHNVRLYVADAFDHQAFFKTLPESSLDADVVTRNMVLLAARRYVELAVPELALRYFNWLYRSADPILEYPDELDICQALLASGDWEGLERVARHGLERADAAILPGFHVHLALCLERRGELQQALEHAFIEQFGVGDFGRFESSAKLGYADIVGHPGDAVMACMRRFHRRYAAAEQAGEGNTKKALAGYREARSALRDAQRKADADYLFLREYAAEVELDICRLEETGFAGPRDMFEAIVAREPWFVPARIQLAWIALLEGDRERARGLWREARRLTPFLHHMVLNFREALDRPNPNVGLRVEPLTGPSLPTGTADQEQSDGLRVEPQEDLRQRVGTAAVRDHPTGTS